MRFIDKIIKSKQTVFTKDDIRKITNYNNENSLRNFLDRAKKSNILQNPRQGIWTLPNYDKFELAYKVRKNSYISLETVLYKEGLIFQYYENTITCVSDDTRNYNIDSKEIRYSKIKNSILNNPIGIREYENYRVATPERALCDMIYILPNTSIENIQNINKVRLNEILKIYPKKTSLYINRLLNVR